MTQDPVSATSTDHDPAAGVPVQDRIILALLGVLLLAWNTLLAWLVFRLAAPFAHFFV